MTSFYDTLKTYDWDDVKQNIMDKSKNDAIAAINNPHRTLDDFMALISPAATPLLEDMAVEANRLTLERFGNTIQLGLVYCGLQSGFLCIIRLEQIWSACGELSALICFILGDFYWL